jgi:hypothetical protein
MQTNIPAALVRAAVLAAALGADVAAQAASYPFQNPALPPQQRIANILSLMTPDEKIAALSPDSGVPRLGIPSFGATEGIHGLVQRGESTRQREPITTTQFPQPPGMGATWDPDLVRQAGAVQSTEARYVTQSTKYKHPMLMQWGPQSDLARDPRWGRSEEVYGEDPFLVGTMATAFTRGIQGDDPKYWRGAPEALPRQQQRGWARQFLVEFRRPAVPRILCGAIPHGVPGRRCARADGRIQRVERHGDGRAPRAAQPRHQAMGRGRDLERRRRDFHARETV